MQGSPTHKAVRNIGRQNSPGVGTNYGLFEGKKNTGYRVQVAAGSAPNIRSVDFSATKRLKMQRGFKLVISGSACIEQAEQTNASKRIIHGIYREQIARLAIEVADAERGTAPQLTVYFHVCDKTSRAGSRLILQARRNGAGAAPHIRIAIDQRRSYQIARRIERADDSLRTLRK